MNGSARKTRSKFCVLHGRRAAQKRRKGGRMGGDSACLKLPWDRGTGGKVKGRDAYVSLFELMFLLPCISSIGVVDSAFSADTVRLRFEPRSSEYVKTLNNYAFYVSNLFLSWLSNITISFSITLLIRNYSEVEGRRKRWTIASNWVYWSFLNMFIKVRGWVIGGWWS